MISRQLKKLKKSELEKILESYTKEEILKAIEILENKNKKVM